MKALTLSTDTQPKMAPEKLANPITKKMVNATPANAQDIAMKLSKEDIPLSWRLLIKKFEKEGHTFVYPIPDGHKLYNKLIYKPWEVTHDLKVYCHTDRFCNKFYIEGTKEKANVWMQDMYAQYPTAGYSTNFQIVEKTEDKVVYTGVQFHSCD